MLKNKRCLITGGAGFIGSHIADLLVEEGASEIVVIDNFTRGTPKNLSQASAKGKVTIIEGDIRDLEVLNKCMEGIDTVFHQAAIRITQCGEQPRMANDILATGTYNVVEACVRNGVRKIIAASSASVYGLAEDFPTTEKHHPYNNDTIYGAAKLYSEGILRSFYAMYDLNYIALRYFNVYGPRMDIYGKYTEVLVRWIERINAGYPPIIFGDGKQTIDFIYINDVARANIAAAKSDITDEVLNIASGTETSLLELANSLMKAMNVQLDIDFQPERKVNPVSRRLASVEKARNLIHFEAKVPLKEGLKRLVDWWLELQ